MTYFGIGMAVALVSIFLTAFVGSLIVPKIKENRDRWGDKTDKAANVRGLIILISFLVSILYGLFLGLCYWSDARGFYGPAPFVLSILFGSAIGASLAGGISRRGKATLPAVIIGGGYLLIAFGILIFAQSDMMNAKEKAKLVGKVEIATDLNKVITPADPAHICLVSESMAKVKAQNALSKFKVAGGVVPGSRYEIGHPTKQFVDGQLWWVFPLEFQGWLKWRQNKEVPGYLRVSAENPFDEGQAVQSDKQGNEIHIQYLNSACFAMNAERHLRYNGYMGKILTDWTFEVDDNWRPYYTASIVERNFGFSGYRVVGIAILDIQTGKVEESSIDKLPKWIDRAIPLDVIDYNITKWGLYSIEGWWYTLWHDDKSQAPTPGWFLTYDTKGACQWFSGFTSTNQKDSALTGFVTIDSRVGVVRFNKATGVTENVAFQTARSLWSNFRDYEPTELTPYNVYGILTYVIPMEYKGQFKGVSLVSLNNFNIKARGDTFEEAASNYRVSISQSGSDRLTPSGGEQKIVKLTGAISLVGMPLMQGKDQVFVFTLNDVKKIFQAVYTYSSPKVPLMKVGHMVVITYRETLEPVVTCLTFDIPAIQVAGGSVEQGKYLENKDKVNKETERVDKNEKRKTLTESERLKNVDPEKLEEFLNQQNKK